MSYEALVPFAHQHRSVKHRRVCQSPECSKFLHREYCLGRFNAESLAFLFEGRTMTTLFSSSTMMGYDPQIQFLLSRSIADPYQASHMMPARGSTRPLCRSVIRPFLPFFDSRSEVTICPRKSRNAQHSLQKLARGDITDLFFTTFLRVDPWATLQSRHSSLSFDEE